MNAAAQAMGLTSTHFSHYDGMPYPTEYSTYSSPADLIRLGEQAMRLPLFRRIVAQRSYHLAAEPGHHGYLWQTTNALLGPYRGMLGIKTGNTDAAGNCFLFSSSRATRWTHRYAACTGGHNKAVSVRPLCNNSRSFANSPAILRLCVIVSNRANR